MRGLRMLALIGLLQSSDLLAGPATRPVLRPATQPVVRAATRPVATRPATATPRPITSGRAPKRGAQQPKERPAICEPLTPEAHARAAAHTAELRQEIQQAVGDELLSFETAHFVIIHNWDRAEESFLRENVEGCYRTISQQFDVPYSETVFAGKPAIFMIAGRDAFNAARRKVAPSIALENVAGFAMPWSDGVASIVMSKPQVTGRMQVSEAERWWASTLAHEMTHIFAARYHTNEFLPTWLNEGVACVIQGELFPETSKTAIPARVRTTDFKLHVQEMLKLRQMRDHGDYIRSQTMVQTLIAAGQGRFVQLVVQIKAGKAAAKALEDVYGWTADDFDEAWREYLRAQFGGR